jgi:ferredoxin
MIDGKARLISDLFCDGLGACIGHCPVGAIEFEEREAEPYNERRVMEENILPKGKNTIIAHLKHLYEHNEMDYFKEGMQIARANGFEIDPSEITGVKKEETMKHQHGGGGCPGAAMMDFTKDSPERSLNDFEESGKRPSQLRQWPVQLHLVQPTASYYKGSDVLIAADCVAYAVADFHKDFLKDKSLAIACPKLDSNQEVYVEKLVRMIDEAKINTLSVMIMEVPCCGGLLQMAKEAASRAQRKVPVKALIVSVQGEIISEDWV